MFKRIVFILSLLLLLKTAVNSVYASPDTPPISASQTSEIFNGSISALNQAIIGNPNDLKSYKSSAVGTFAFGIDSLIDHQPISTREFIAYERQRFHIPGTPVTAYAATSVGGTGYTELVPVLKIWTVMRNLAYFCFAIIFVVVGIMILLRSKIDPKTVMTVQNALPKIILSLVVVTFSYAIAGLLIDFMYVSLALIVTIFGYVDVDTSNMARQILENNIFKTILNGSTWGNIGNAASAIQTLVQQFINGAKNQGIDSSILGLAAGGLAYLIIAVAILFVLFKTWLMLLSAYANIILGVIFSPIQLMMDSIPGQNQLEGWIRNMLANLMAFPAVLAMLLLGQYLAKLNTGNVGAEPGFTPPLIGATDTLAIQALIGIAIILTMPKAVEMIQEIIKAPKNKWGNAWGEAVKWGGERTFDVGSYGARKGAQAVGATTWWSGVQGAYQGAGGGPRGLVQGAREAVRPIIK